MKIKKEDLAFMSDASVAALESAYRPAHLILWMSLIFVMMAIIWASFANLDEITRGDGKVIPSSDVQVIQNLEGGIIKQILVQEGALVQKDQVLMVIDDTGFSSSFKENQSKLDALEAKIRRLSAEVRGRQILSMPKNLNDAEKKHMEGEIALFKQRNENLKVKIQILENQTREKQQQLKEMEEKKKQLGKSYTLIKKELALTYPLVKQGAASEVEVLRLERSANDIKGELEAAKLAVPRLEEAVKGATRKIEETKLNFQVDAQEQLNESKATYASLRETDVALADKVERTLVRSPVKGTVNQISLKTIGGIVQPGQVLMEIVPLEDTLLIEAEIKPADIGFLRPHLKAVVKLTAFDFAIYGSLTGVVEQISPDTILNDNKENVYLILVRTDKNYLEKGGRKLDIMPGMRASVDILTGKKTVMDYLLKPILKTRDQALTER